MEIIGGQASLGDGLEDFPFLIRQKEAGRLGLHGSNGAVHDQMQQGVHIGGSAEGVTDFDERL